MAAGCARCSDKAKAASIWAIAARRRRWAGQRVTQRAAARIGAVGILPPAGLLVTLAEPGRPACPLSIARRWQFGRRQPRGEHSVRTPHAAGVRANKGRQLAMRPPRTERGLDGRTEPFTLRGGQPPRLAEHAEELADRTAAAEPAAVGRQRLARTRGCGGRFPARFFVRFGCNRCTPWLRQLHPVRAPVAPRSRHGVQRLHSAD
jgi:hypothetical protein